MIRRSSAVALFVLSACGAPAANSPPPAPCTCETGCIEQCAVEESAATSYRKVVRDPVAPANPPTESTEPFEPADVAVDVALDEAEVAKVAETLKREPGVILAAFRADFGRTKGTELALLLRTGELVFYSKDRKVAHVLLGEPIGEATAIRAVRLIDGRTELVIRHREEGVERVTVCRLIGRAVARVFDSPTADGEVGFVRRGDERAIVVTDSDGTPTVYRWNRWEGMFRVPMPAPTSPLTR